MPHHSVQKLLADTKGDTELRFSRGVQEQKSIEIEPIRGAETAETLKFRKDEKINQFQNAIE
jgi:hypothetical protein